MIGKLLGDFGDIAADGSGSKQGILASCQVVYETLTPVDQLRPLVDAGFQL